MSLPANLQKKSNARCFPVNARFSQKITTATWESTGSYFIVVWLLILLFERRARDSWLMISCIRCQYSFHSSKLVWKTQMHTIRPSFARFFPLCDYVFWPGRRVLLVIMKMAAFPHQTFPIDVTMKSEKAPN